MAILYYKYLKNRILRQAKSFLRETYKRVKFVDFW